MTNLKRVLPLALLALVLAFASTGQVARAAEEPKAAAVEVEKKPPLLPPLTGEGSEQTVMEAVWVLIIFAILLAVLYPTAWKNVLAGLKARESRIRSDIAQAEDARTKAEATLRQYTQQLSDAEAKVRDILAKAAADAEKVGQSIRMQAQQESEEIKERANKEIEASKNQALAEIYEQTANLATNVAEKILRRSLNAADQQDLVQQSLNQMQELSRN